MPAAKSPPAWVSPFLASLARTGNVRVSAEAAGVDVTNAYNRRARYPEFAAAWARVLLEREERAALRDGPSTSSVPPQDERKERTPPPSSAIPLPTNSWEEEELVPRTTAFGAKLARSGSHRWSAAAQERFLIELGMTANVKRSARAAGFSQEAIYKRRLKDKNFAAAWDEALELGRVRVRAFLYEAANRTFDPEELPIGEEGEAALPRMTVGEAIQVARLKGLREGKSGPVRGPAWEEEEPDDSQVEEARARIFARLDRLREKIEREQGGQRGEGGEQGS